MFKVEKKCDLGAIRIVPKKEIGPQRVSRVLRGADYFGSADQRFSQNLRNFREISARYPRGTREACTYAGARGRAPSAVPTGYRRVPRHTCRLARGASSAAARPPAPPSQVSIGGRASERPPPRRLGRSPASFAAGPAAGRNRPLAHRHLSGGCGVGSRAPPLRRARPSGVERARRRRPRRYKFGPHIL